MSILHRVSIILQDLTMKRQRLLFFIATILTIISANAQTYKDFLVGAKQGNVQAQFNLGSCYYHGKGVAQNHKEAVKWFRLAAGQELAEAQYNLGICYVTGDGIEKDIQQAKEWIKKAARNGNEQAQSFLKKSYNETW